MLIGGIQKSSLIDYKGKIAAVVFLQGCNFSCPYCHNPELVLGGQNNSIYKEDVLSFLKTRVNKLDGVVISGGEPTLHNDLEEFIQQIKSLGFKVKLDTNGTNPKILFSLIENSLIDYVAMDIKSSLDEYKTVTRKDVDIKKIETSREIILNSNIDYEFRTTVVKNLLTFNSFVKINNEFDKLRGSNKIKRYYLQKFQKSKHVDESYINAQTFDDETLDKVVELFKNSVETVCVR